MKLYNHVYIPRLVNLLFKFERDIRLSKDFLNACLTFIFDMINDKENI